MGNYTIYTPSSDARWKTEGDAAEPHDPRLLLEDGAFAVSIRLPYDDGDARLFLELLAAATDNALSLVELRRLNRERTVPVGEAVIGWNGAGSDSANGDMEANRG